MKIDDQKLKQELLAQNLITEKSLKTLELQAQTQGISLMKLLFDREIIPDEKLGTVVAKLYDVPFVKVGEKSILETTLRIVPYTLAANQMLIPFEQKQDELSIATCHPDNYELISSLEKKTGLNVKVYYATNKDVKSSLKVYNRDVNAKFGKLLKSALEDPNKIESLKDAAKILDTIILFAYQNNASDIHIEPHKDFISVRYRIDGLLQTITDLPLKILELIVTRIKVLANLPTDEHMAALDGRFKIDLENNEITLRVSIVPTYDGEKVVMRLLSSPSQELNIASLGYNEKNLKFISKNLQKTHGIILVTGPTGSGKTTTMYSMLKMINSPEVNISTIEDPIEYRLEGINQIQVNPKTNLTFADGLRSLLRQDPDVLMVGEIRDQETATIAINAALTGHLVLATLHTNDVASTLPRLTEMDIEPFLIAATVQLVVAQRLVRTICPNCKTAQQFTMEEIKALSEKFELKFNLAEEVQKLTSDTKITFYKGQGCDKCANSGYKGRSTIAEVMEVSDEIKKLLFSKASPKEIEQQALKEGMDTMFSDGLAKVLQGLTSIEEILRVIRS
ncbi:type II/IV secretion system protein [Candidatus Peregrinibacteria bacterium]|nr:type II/IV secretion system protein [Candidatus Peregrinibacteria bacterium]